MVQLLLLSDISENKGSQSRSMTWLSSCVLITDHTMYCAMHVSGSITTVSTTVSLEVVSEQLCRLPSRQAVDWTHCSEYGCYAPTHRRRLCSITG